jgi:hypothetical protein
MGGRPTLPLGISDLVCAVLGTRSASGAPQNLALRLAETNIGRLAWNAPASGGQDGYVIAALSGGVPVVIPASATSASFPIREFDCYVVVAIRAGSPMGNTDVVCAAPTYRTWTPPGTGSTSSEGPSQPNGPPPFLTPTLISALDPWARLSASTPEKTAPR